MGSSWTRDQSNPCPLNWQEDSLPLDHQGNPPDEICKKEKRHRGLLSSTNEDTVIYKLGRGSSPEPCHASTLIPDFLASRTIRSKNLSFKPRHLWYFVTSAQEDQYSYFYWFLIQFYLLKFIGLTLLTYRQSLWTFPVCYKRMFILQLLSMLFCKCKLG